MIKQKQDGFSLIEVMVSISILSFIMLGILAVTDNSFTVKDRLVSEDRSRLQVETAFSRFEWDFSQIYSPLYFSHDLRVGKNPTEKEVQAFNAINGSYADSKRFAFASYDSLPVPIFDGDKNESFHFFTLSNRRKTRNSHESNYAWVNYALTDDDTENSITSKVLIRQFWPMNPFDKKTNDWSDVKEQVLLRNVESIKFEFWDPLKKKWTDNQSTIPSGNHIIHGLKISIEWAETQDIKLLFVRVLRPLFPYFIPEDMYKLKEEVNASRTTTPGNTPATPAVPPADDGDGDEP